MRVRYTPTALDEGVPYRATQGELIGIDRGLKAAREGRFATDDDVAQVLAKYRRS